MPYEIVRKFEQTIAEFAGSKHAVAVESGSAAILLSCLYVRKFHPAGTVVTIPKRTYPSVPCSLILAGFRVQFSDEPWQGVYELAPLGIYDAALRFRKGMHEWGLWCLSFHIKKHLGIGRGGCILTNDADAAKWLKLARFDGREECDLPQQKEFKVIGLNAYMTPEQAARGLQLLSLLKNKGLDPPDLDIESQGYPDLSQSEIYW